MKIVIDTNVVISAALGSKTCTKALLKASHEDIIVPRLITEELKRFLAKVESAKKIDKNKLTELHNFFQYFINLSIITKDYSLYSYSDDLPDNHFLSVASHHRAYLIIGDLKCQKIAKENEIMCYSPAQYITLS
ncbi:MAG: putative toxin-antitoxin system toxin component, PIN family [Kosmotogaceae bacterium]